MVNYIVRKESLETVADAIRAKAGGTEKLVFPAGFVDAVENISVGSAPDGSSVTFGYEWITQITQSPTGKARFNGVLLPEIPEDVLAQYPYAWIRDNRTTGQYQLILSATGFYLNGSTVTDKNTSINPQYNITAIDASATGWVNANNSQYNAWSIDTNRTVLWSNHDIPKGSATATDIYFNGSEPVIEVKEVYETTFTPVEREESYAIAGADLNELGAVTQKMAGKRALLTVADMIYWLNRVQFVPQGNAESTLNVVGVFTSDAVGVALQEG